MLSFRLFYHLSRIYCMWGMDHSWAWKKGSLKINPFSWSSLLPKTVSHGIPAGRFMSWPVFSPGIQGFDLTLFCSLVSGSWTPPYHSHCSQACPDHILYQFFLLCKYNVQQKTSSCWTPDSLKAQQSADPPSSHREDLQFFLLGGRYLFIAGRCLSGC